MRRGSPTSTDTKAAHATQMKTFPLASDGRVFSFEASQDTNAFWLSHSYSGTQSFGCMDLQNRLNEAQEIWCTASEGHVPSYDSCQEGNGAATEKQRQFTTPPSASTHPAGQSCQETHTRSPGSHQHVAAAPRQCSTHIHTCTRGQRAL